MNSYNKQRSSYLDNLCGLLIIYVVFFYHLPDFCKIENTSVFICFRNILDYFMAWFFYKSGMFAIKRPFIEELKIVLQRLIKPFFIINAICIVLNILIDRGEGLAEHILVSIYRESNTLCIPLWFCLSLSIVRLLYQAIAILTDNYKWLILCLSVCVSYLLFLFTYRLIGLKETLLISIPFWFGNIFLGLFFYLLGYLLRTKHFNHVLFIVALLIYSIHFFTPFYLDFYINNSGNYFLSVLFYISGIIVFNNIFKRWLDVRIPILTYIGENSMIYYVTHYTFLYLLLIGHSYRISGWPLYIVSFIITIFFLVCMDFLFRKKLGWVIGK